mgnify:CR=1 FL=1
MENSNIVSDRNRNFSSRSKIRTKPYNKYSIAFCRFSRRQEWLSHLYWFNKNNGDYSINLLPDDDANFMTDMNINVNMWKNVPQTSKEWHQWNEYNEDWLKGITVLSAVANLDSYVRSIIKICVCSQPCILNDQNSHEGILTCEYSKGRLMTLTSSLTKGPWDKRMDNFKDKLEIQFERNSFANLDDIKNLRNKIAHYIFNVDYYSGNNDFNVLDNGFPKISLEDFKRYLNTLRDVALDIDKKLMCKYIGNFELLDFIYRNKDKPFATCRRDYNAMGKGLPHFEVVSKVYLKRVYKYLDICTF